jgi:CII-binding regulator of phage lambda lysogenization HflD
MAESSENDKKGQDQLADDLDSMLDATVDEVADQEELIDDEDAIDRLLMDNAFDAPEDNEIDEFAEIDELISDNLEPPTEDMEDVDKLFDELTEDEFADEPDEPGIEDDAGNIEPEAELETAIAELADEVEDNPVTLTGPEDTSLNADEIAEDLAVTTAGDMEEAVEPAEAIGTDPAESNKVGDDFDITAFDDDDISDTEVASADSQPADPITQQTDYSVEIADIKAQLMAVNQALINSGEQTSAVADDERLSAVSQGLETVADDQKKVNRQMAALEQKKPILTYVALTIAIIALLVGGGLGMIGVGANSEVEELSETVESLDESVQAWIAKSNNADEMIKVSKRLDQMDNEVANFTSKLSELTKTVDDNGDNQQLTDLQQQVVSLKEQLAKTTETLDSVQQKMTAVATVKRAPKKTVRKTVASRTKWTVNLISFKQEWYAKRKAAEFDKQGIPVDIMTVVIKGETWYRLRVKGFATKTAASDYAGKVKKSLNLTSVWVTRE